MGLSLEYLYTVFLNTWSKFYSKYIYLFQAPSRLRTNENITFKSPSPLYRQHILEPF